MDDIVEPEVKTKSVSYSQFSTWSTCQHMWKLKYVDGRGRGDDGISAAFGSAMHDTIQYWIKILYTEDPIHAKVFDMHEKLKERLSLHAKERLLSGEKQLTTKEELAEFYADGCNILDHVRKYAKDWFPKNYQLIGTEVPLDIELENNLRFKGFIDVILYHKALKTIYIYDFKTARFGWTYQKKDVKKTDQLLLYKKFYSKKFGVSESNIKVEFIILKRKVSENSAYETKHVVGFEPSHGSISMKKTMERFSSFLTSAFDSAGQFKTDTIKATPSESACKYCPFNKNEEICSYSVFLSNEKRKLTK